MLIFFITSIACFTFQNIGFKLFSLNHMRNFASYFAFNAVYCTLICAMYAVPGLRAGRAASR